MHGQLNPAPARERVRWWRSMVFKLGLLMAVSIGAFSAVTLFLQMRRQNDLYRAEAIDSRVKQTHTLYKMIRKDMIALRDYELAPVIMPFVEQNPDISWVCATGPGRVLISSADKKSCPAVPNRKPLPALSDKNVSVSLASSGDLNFVEVEEFIDPDRHAIGSLRIGFLLMDAIETERFRKVIRLEQTIASITMRLLDEFNFAEIDYATKDLSSSDTNIRYVIVTGGDFKVLSHPDPQKKFKRMADPVSKASERTGPYNPIAVQYVTIKGEPLMDMALAQFRGGERIAGVRIGYSLAAQRERERISAIRLAAIAAGFVAFTIFCSVLLARRFSAPMLRLASVARRVGLGDLTARAEYRHGGDELRLLTNAFNNMIDGLKERDLVKDTFSRYVTKQVADEILKDPGKIVPGGSRREVTILFSDIRGFTTFSENQPPEQVLAHLNEYLSSMVDVIFKYEGTLDKFIGDAVMAVYGSPIPQDDAPMRAVRTAIEMQQRLTALNEKWTAENKPHLAMGIGINTGEVIAGNIGDPRRMEYTVIGDNVNLASRIEGLTRNFSCPIIISQSTYEQVRDKVEARELESVKVKGKQQEVLIYELLGLKDDA